MKPETEEEVLKSLVEELTLSGLPVLDEAKMRRIKKMCKRSDSNVVHLFSLLSAQLGKNHSEIRLSAFLIIDAIFRRSHLFRTLFTKNFLKTYLELVFEVDPGQPLPPPKEAAKAMKTKAILAMDHWNTAYGFAYRRLSLAHHYLKTCHKVDFASVTTEHRAIEEMKRKREEMAEERRRDRLEKTRDKVRELRTEGENCVKELENGLKVLVPDFAEPSSGNGGDSLDFHEQDFASEGGGGGGTAWLAGLGMGGASYSLELDLGATTRLEEEEGNEDLIRRLDELAGDIKRRHLNRVKTWLKSLSKDGGTQSEIVALVDYKENIHKLIEKYEGLNVQRRKRADEMEKKDDEDEDDDDFEDVLDAEEKEGFEPVIAPHRREEYGLGPVGDVQPSTTARSRRLVNTTTTTRTTKKRHLNESDPTCHLATVKKLKASGALRGKEAEGVEAGSEPGLKRRSMHFAGSFVPVQHKCNVALHNGKLCPRMDRVKCPFHGKIIPRDAKGLPLDEEKRKAELARKERKEERKTGKETEEEKEGEEKRPWMDLELIRDIETETGNDLGSRFLERKLRKEKGGKGKEGKKKKGKEKAESHLTVVKKSGDGVRARLEKKLLNKSTMKRVNAVLDDLDRRKTREKFGDQFNYV